MRATLIATLLSLIMASAMLFERGSKVARVALSPCPSPFTNSVLASPADAGSSEGLAAGDFNGDGKLDLVQMIPGAVGVPGQLPEYVSIYLGDGAGHFSGPTNFTAPFNPYDVAVADLKRG